VSVLVPPGAAALDVEVRFAEYVPIEGDDHRTRWRRVPRQAALTLPLTQALAAGVAVPGCPGLRLVGHVESVVGVAQVPDGCVAVSLFLVNGRPVLDPQRRDEAFMFQVQLEVRPAQGAFVARPDVRAAASDDADDRVAELQFRSVLSFGVGHNVSVEESPTGAWVRTTWLPEGRVRAVRTRAAGHTEVHMEVLASLTDGPALRAALAPLVADYSAWIAQQAQVAVGAEHAETRAELLHDARIARDRIQEGIDRLVGDATARRAFCWMNEAMALAARQRNPERYADGSAPQWRLFQLAFVLLNLCGINDDEHKDREAVELIFFPTGGGKTEAYLGVATGSRSGAAPAARHRTALHQGAWGGGAAALYAAALDPRPARARGDPHLCAGAAAAQAPAGAGRGALRHRPVGGALGHRQHHQAGGQTVTDYKNGKGSSPFPLTACPWCRADLKPTSFKLMPGPAAPESVQISCLQPKCDFNERQGGLPVLFVDEQIYRELPCFLLATVDKFAMLPWRGEAGALFGRVHSREGQNFFGPMDTPLLNKKHTPLPDGLVPPELIVQDEVHLISGPLGTMVGLYETAVERLCHWATVSGAPRRPKILASTATVRRAGAQMRALFGRGETRVFPPPGIDDGESFFAEIDGAMPDRRYVGIAAAGRSFKAVQLRVFVTLLAAAEHARKRVGAAADPWLTLVGYYNALRELGGMRRLAEDEVRTRCARAGERLPDDAVGTPHRWLANRSVDAVPVELTSRESTARIAEARARLGLAHGQKGSVDVALATNMISVGLDIDRLGLMVVAGQPKTTSEYIQSSSRVGRQAQVGPGLVATCLNLYRPRDRSHYEHFAAWHASFYRHVEATSLTPFSAPALDRGLAGLLVALVRHSDERLTPPRGVEGMPKLRAQADALAQVIAERACRVAGAVSEVTKEAEDALVAEVSLRARGLLDAWEKIIEQAQGDAGKRSYSGFDVEKPGKPLLRTALEVDPLKPATPEERKFIAPTSMRDVEPSVHVWLNLKPEMRKA
jgi:hypothetical protein